MCEYCGCRQIEPLAELMDEHLALLDVAGEVRRDLEHRRLDEAVAGLRRLAGLLDRHARREEDGVFTALRERGEFEDEVADLTAEHADFHARLDALDPRSTTLKADAEALFAHLTEHIDREDLGIFPVSTVSLGARGWDLVTEVHEAQPSFLADA
jgi:hemerythrin-like domain-containing protein